ncbi:hypothetical protein D3C71_2013290 [compost metagenome]
MLEIIGFKLPYQRLGAVDALFCLLQLVGFFNWGIGINAITHLIQLLFGLLRCSVGNLVLLLYDFRFFALI